MHHAFKTWCIVSTSGRYATIKVVVFDDLDLFVSVFLLISRKCYPICSKNAVRTLATRLQVIELFVCANPPNKVIINVYLLPIRFRAPVCRMDCYPINKLTDDITGQFGNWFLCSDHLLKIVKAALKIPSSLEFFL